MRKRLLYLLATMSLLMAACSDTAEGEGKGGNGPTLDKGTDFPYVVTDEYDQTYRGIQLGELGAISIVDLTMDQDYSMDVTFGVWSNLDEDEDAYTLRKFQNRVGMRMIDHFGNTIAEEKFLYVNPFTKEDTMRVNGSEYKFDNVNGHASMMFNAEKEANAIPVAGGQIQFYDRIEDEVLGTLPFEVKGSNPEAPMEGFDWDAFQISEPVDLNVESHLKGVDVTYNNYRTTSYNGYEEAPEGKEYVLLNVTYSNPTDEALKSPVMKDMSNAEYGEDFRHGNELIPEEERIKRLQVDLAPQSSVEGTYLYLKRKDQEEMKMRLYYATTMLSEDIETTAILPFKD